MIDAYAVAKGAGMGTRINTIMQTCFFAISGVLPRDEAIAHIKHAIEKTYSKRGEAVVQRNFDAVDATLAHLHEVAVPALGDRACGIWPPLVPDDAPDFVKRVTAVMLADQGDRLPVSAFPIDGTWPTGTREVGEAQHRHRDPGVGRAAVHPVQQVRAGLSARRDSRQGVPTRLAGRGARRRSNTCRSRATTSPAQYTVQVAPEDCTGCIALRDDVPGEGQDESRSPGDRHGAAGAAARGGARELRVLPRAA